jgi:hypothetical protein
MADKKPDPKSKSDEPTNPATAAHRAPDPKDDPKPAPKDADPVAPEVPAVPAAPEPDDAQMPHNFTSAGDAEPITDPHLAPEAQQPFESEADFKRRTGQSNATPGVFDAMVDRGEDHA